MIRSRGEKCFQLLNICILSLLSLTMILPFIHIAAKSLSSEAYVLAKEVLFWPKGFTLLSYQYVLENRQFFYSFTNSVFLAVVGTLLSMAITILAAYSLSRRYVPFTRTFMLIIIITMFFSGGLIPTYLVVKSTGLINSIWSLIIPVVMSPFNLILIRNFFMSIPDALEESAKMDGANNFRILISIYLPLSVPALATISMFYAVGYWNSFFNAMMYITERRLMPLQMFLFQLISEEGINDLAMTDVFREITAETIRASSILCAVLPILCIYPFIQRYFVQGIMLGAVKG